VNKVFTNSMATYPYGRLARVRFDPLMSKQPERDPCGPAHAPQLHQIKFALPARVYMLINDDFLEGMGRRTQELVAQVNRLVAGKRDFSSLMVEQSAWLRRRRQGIHIISDLMPACFWTVETEQYKQSEVTRQAGASHRGGHWAHPWSRGFVLCHGSPCQVMGGRHVASQRRVMGGLNIKGQVAET
jgi:hypothetical protein